jgi:hypothetical protein
LAARAGASCAAVALVLAGACASAEKHPGPGGVGEVAPGVHVSDVCGDPDPIPRVRVRAVDPGGQGLPGALVEIRQKGAPIAEGKADEEGAALFALRAAEYTVAWSLAGFEPPAPVRVRGRAGCEILVVFTPRPAPR